MKALKLDKMLDSKKIGYKDKASNFLRNRLLLADSQLPSLLKVN